MQFNIAKYLQKLKIDILFYYMERCTFGNARFA